MPDDLNVKSKPSTLQGGPEVVKKDPPVVFVHFSPEAKNEEPQPVKIVKNQSPACLPLENKKGIISSGSSYLQDHTKSQVLVKTSQPNISSSSLTQQNSALSVTKCTKNSTVVTSHLLNSNALCASSGGVNKTLVSTIAQRLPSKKIRILGVGTGTSSQSAAPLKASRVGDGTSVFFRGSVQKGNSKGTQKSEPTKVFPLGKGILSITPVRQEPTTNVKLKLPVVRASAQATSAIGKNSTINIVTGKSSALKSNILPLKPVSLTMTKPHMINFKITNGQIQREGSFSKDNSVRQQSLLHNLPLELTKIVSCDTLIKPLYDTAQVPTGSINNSIQDSKTIASSKTDLTITEAKALPSSSCVLNSSETLTEKPRKSDKFENTLCQIMPLSGANKFKDRIDKNECKTIENVKSNKIIEHNSMIKNVRSLLLDNITSLNSISVEVNKVNSNINPTNCFKSLASITDGHNRIQSENNRDNTFSENEQVSSKGENVSQKQNVYTHHARKSSLRDKQKEDLVENKNLPSSKSMDDIYCCENCGCYGLSSEFIRDNTFCSESCAEEYDANDGMWEKDKHKFEKQKAKKKESILKSNTEGTPQEKVNGKEKLSSVLWMDKSNFSWVRYLEYCGRNKGLSKAAPLRLWSEPFPFNRNLFKCGMRLEGIDPHNQSLFCILTVSKVLGYRIRLHFDGYSDQHDFWINADSRNIFPVGWCEKSGKNLEIPPGFINFSWKSYLEYCKATAAPRQAFFTKQSASLSVPTGFRVGMKLEAEDRKTNWICVATVADVIDSRILVHFDGWDKAFNFWTDISSPYIHPAGYCVQKEIHLYPPRNYSGVFNWTEYLNETKSVMVPSRAFKPRSPKEFKKNMKLEVVDKRNPSLVRVATIVDVENYRIKIHFDGWGNEYDYWVDDDSEDVHPPSWCSKTGHPLEPPVFETNKSGEACTITGCFGIGHIKGPHFSTHHTLLSCPYSSQNLSKDIDCLIPDRFACTYDKKKPKVAVVDLKEILVEQKTRFEKQDSLETSKRVRKKRKFFDEEVSSSNLTFKIPKSDEAKPASTLSKSCNPIISPSLTSHNALHQKNSIQKNPPYSSVKIKHEILQSSVATVHQSVFNPGYIPNPSLPVPSIDKLQSLKDIINNVDKSRVESLDPESITNLVCKVPGCENVGSVIIEQQIDGESFLMLTQNDLITLLGLKVGPAVKLMNIIMGLKNV